MMMTVTSHRHHKTKGQHSLAILSSHNHDTLRVTSGFERSQQSFAMQRAALQDWLAVVSDHLPHQRLPHGLVGSQCYATERFNFNLGELQARPYLLSKITDVQALQPHCRHHFFHVDLELNVKSVVGDYLTNMSFLFFY